MAREDKTRRIDVTELKDQQRLKEPLLDYSQGDTLMITSHGTDLGQIYFRPGKKQAGFTPRLVDGDPDHHVEPDWLQAIELALRHAVAFWQCDKLDQDLRRWNIDYDLVTAKLEMRYENF